MLKRTPNLNQKEPYHKKVRTKVKLTNLKDLKGQSLKPKVRNNLFQVNDKLIK